MKFFEALHLARDRMLDADMQEAQAQSRQLLFGILDMSPARYVLQARQDMTPEQEECFLSALERRLSGEPLQYIVGHWEFYGREFACDPRALIPREDTQVLLECVLARAPRRPLRGIDLGSGSGILGITLALERPEYAMTCLDLSREALELTAQNAKRLSAPIACLHGDMTQPLAEGPYDLIVSNPPYIVEGDRKTLAAELSYEPQLALFGGADGLDCYRALARRIEDSLNPGGLIAVEVGQGQAQTVAELFAPVAEQIQVEKDFAGIDRVVSAVKKG